MNPSEIEDKILDILNKSKIVDELSIKILQSLIERIENFEDDRFSDYDGKEIYLSK